MINYVLIGLMLFSLSSASYAEEPKQANKNSFSLTGTIRNYSNKPIYIYQCYTDTLLFIDSVKTDSQGKFSYYLPFAKSKSGVGLYRINLSHQNQWFYVLYDKQPIILHTVYIPDYFYNWAMDSMRVIKSEENKLFYRFQKLQIKKVVADRVMREMLRLFPYFDSYRDEMEKEYMQRYQSYQKLVQEANKKYRQFMATKIINAYYDPNPDWKQPDPWRDSIIAAHYFDYFNPADSFYLYTNILPEKMDIYLKLMTNKRDAYGQPVYNVMDEAKAAGTFLDKIKGTNKQLDFHSLGKAQVEAYEFCLNYFLKLFDNQRKEQAFVYLYDNYLNPLKGDCGEESNKWTWARAKAELYKGLLIGMPAPDFELDTYTGLSLYSIQSSQILLLFYASWCPHCEEEVQRIKQLTDTLSSNEFTIIAISLDTSSTAWSRFVNKYQLLNWMHYSEWKSWKSEVVKLYNVYATPTMFLLNKDKIIISKPISAIELLRELRFKNTKKIVNDY